MNILVIGAVFLDVKGFPEDLYIPDGRNVGRIEYIHGGVARNVAEDIANVELKPTFLSLVDDSPMGKDIIDKLNNHKVNTEYMLTVPDGMGTWLAVFDNNGDVAGSISKRPDLMPIVDLLEERGDEIFSKTDTVVLESDIDLPLVKKVLELCKKHDVKLVGLVSNMGIAAKRRDLLQQFDCFICNQQEAGILFAGDYSQMDSEELKKILPLKIKAANIPAMIVTLGDKGAVYADLEGNCGSCPAKKVQVKDTTGAGDAFCAGVAIGLTFSKTWEETIEIGSTLAASVITSSENVCPRFLPEEFGISA